MDKLVWCVAISDHYFFGRDKSESQRPQRNGENTEKFAKKIDLCVLSSALCSL